MKRTFLFALLAFTCVFNSKAQELDTLPHQTYYDALELRSYLRVKPTWRRDTIKLDATNKRELATTQGDETSEIRAYPDTLSIVKTDQLDTSLHFRVKYVFLKRDTLFESSDASKTAISALLKNYYKDNWGNLKDYFIHLKQDNAFLSPYISTSFTAAGSSPTGIANILSSVGGLDVTAFADGLAQFLVERTKDELNEAFFRKFASFLNYYPEFKTLFPNTQTFVDNFNSWEYANLLNTLKEAFDKDIKQIMANFIKLRYLKKSDCQPAGTTTCNNLCNACQQRVDDIGKFFRKNEGLFLLSALQIGNGILSEQKVPDILFSVTKPDFLLGYTDATNPQAATDLKNTLQLMNIVSYSLKSNQTGKHYLTSDEFALLGSDPALRRLYIGLIYQQIKNANNGSGLTIGNLDVSTLLTPQNLDGLTNYSTNLLNQARNLQGTYDKLVKDRLDAKADLSPDYASVFDAVKTFLQAASNTTLINRAITIPAKLSTVFELTSQTLQIAHDISVRNYNAVVIGTLKFISDASKPYINDYPGLQQFNSALLKYGSFAANVVLSKNAEEVKESIKSFALPAGSSSIKKNSYFNISLNAYVGFSWGIKNNPSKSSYKTKATDGTDSVVKLNGGASVGVYAPVGIGFNWGHILGPKNPWSVSAFVSLIDVGALVGYRFVNDTTQISNSFKVSLSNILAPGGNIIIGLPNMPISIGGGLQWIPTLQRDPSSNTLYNVNYSGVRWQLFVAVDLPLLNFHTSKKSLLLARIQH